MSENPNDALWDPRPRIEPSPEAAEIVPYDDGLVMVELAGGAGMSPVAALDVARQLEPLGFALDEESEVTTLGKATSSETYVVQGRVSDDAVVTELERDPRVVKVWRDTPVAPF